MSSTTASGRTSYKAFSPERPSDRSTGLSRPRLERQLERSAEIVLVLDHEHRRPISPGHDRPPGRRSGPLSRATTPAAASLFTTVSEPPEQLGELSADWQPQPGALTRAPARSSSVKRFKDALEFVGPDAGAVIEDLDDPAAVAPRRRAGHLSVGELRGVAEEIGHDLHEPDAIRRCRRTRITALDDVDIVRRDPADVIDRVGHRIRNVDGGALEPQRAGLELCEHEQVVDESPEPECATLGSQGHLALLVAQRITLRVEQQIDVAPHRVSGVRSSWETVATNAVFRSSSWRRRSFCSSTLWRAARSIPSSRCWRRSRLSCAVTSRYTHMPAGDALADPDRQKVLLEDPPVGGLDKATPDRFAAVHDLECRVDEFARFCHRLGEPLLYVNGRAADQRPRARRRSRSSRATLALANATLPSLTTTTASSSVSIRALSSRPEA